MLLGDGCLKTKHHTAKDGKQSTYYEYVICHSTKQQAYIEHKVKLFHNIMGGKFPKLSYGKIMLGSTEHQTVRFSRCHSDFRLLHRKLYCNNDKKFFTRDVLDYLNAQAIALWYMDDGTLSKSKRPDGTVRSVEMRICTYFSELEADVVVKYFQDVWLIQAKKRRYHTGQYLIVFNTTESKKFELLIKPYIIQEMMYKLPSKWTTRAQGNL